MMHNFISYNIDKLQYQLRKRPYAVRVDTNNTCNLNCIYCEINDHIQSAEYMSVEQFSKLAKLFFSKSRYVSLSFGTEPLMSKKFILFIEELGKYNVPSTHFITNGLLLTENIIKASIIARISAITISNDAATAATYQRIRGKTIRGNSVKTGEFKNIIAKLKLIHELKNKYKSSVPIVRIQFTLFDYNKAEAAPFIEKYHSYFQEFYLTHLSPMYLDNYTDPILKRISRNEFIELKTKIVDLAGKYNLSTKITFNDIDRRNLSNKWCSFPLVNRFICHNGDLLMCDKQVYGNIFAEDLSDINRRINDAFQKYNPNCTKKCTQPIAKAKEVK